MRFFGEATRRRGTSPARECTSLNKDGAFPSPNDAKRERRFYRGKTRKPPFDPLNLLFSQGISATVSVSCRFWHPICIFSGMGSIDIPIRKSMEKQTPFACIVARPKRPNRRARHGSMTLNLPQNPLLENMRQIDANRRARPTPSVCEIDYSIRVRGLGPIVKGFCSRRMVRWCVCTIYLSLLTMILLSPNPAAVIGLKNIPSVPGGDATMHLGSFTLLTILVHSMRWPKPLHWSWVYLLLGYAAAIESLQAFVPPRSVEFQDFVANVFGIAAGSAIYWALQRTFQVLCGITVSMAKRWSLRTAFNAAVEPCLETSA